MVGGVKEYSSNNLFSNIVYYQMSTDIGKHIVGGGRMLFKAEKMVGRFKEYS